MLKLVLLAMQKSEVEMGKRTNDLDLDIDLDQALRERIDLNQARVDSAIESTKLSNQPNVTLGNRLVWVRADDAARNGTQSSDA